MSTLIVGFFKNSKSYYAAIWQHIKHWKDAKSAIGVRFQKYEVPVYHRGVVVLREVKFRAIATFESKDGRIISRQCSSKGWPLYSVQEAAPHTKYFQVIGLDGFSNSKPSDYFTCLEGCGCPAYWNKVGLIDGYCKHQLMIADEIGLNELEDDEEDFKPPFNFPNPLVNWGFIKDEDKVDLNKFSKASINFGAVKPKPKQPETPKSPPGTLRVIEKNGYAFFNISTGQFEEEHLSKEEINPKAIFYEKRGHKIEGLFDNKYWYFYEARGWVEFSQWKRETQEAREMLGLGLR